MCGNKDNQDLICAYAETNCVKVEGVQMVLAVCVVMRIIMI